MSKKYKNLVEEELLARKGVYDEHDEYETESSTYGANGKPVILKSYTITDYLPAEFQHKNVESSGETPNLEDSE